MWMVGSKEIVTINNSSTNDIYEDLYLIEEER